MDISRMLELTRLSTAQLGNLFAKSEALKDIAANFSENVELAMLRNQIVDVIDHFYDLGRVTDVYEIFGGYVNRSFGIYTEKDGKQYEYFVRKYKKGIAETEIELEHTLIDFSIVNGLDIAAGLIRSKDQKTFVKMSETMNGETMDRYFAVYDFLNGEDRYTWDNNLLKDKEFASSAEVLAIFHNASRDYDPQGRERVEPKIMEFVPTLSDTFKEFTKLNLGYNRYHTYYLKNIDEILEVIDQTKIPAESMKKMPYNPVHSDYHPGNLKFEGTSAVGIFDFDWAKIDLRLFDVCLALAYFCSAWEDLPDGSTDGVLRLDKCRIFIQAYQNKLKELNGLSPLNETEIEYFPTMMAAANLYLINWDVTAYYADYENLNVFEYLFYLQHNVRLMKWIENHKQELAELAKSI